MSKLDKLLVNSLKKLAKSKGEQLKLLANTHKWMVVM